MNLSMKQKQTRRSREPRNTLTGLQNQLIATREGGKDRLEFGINRYKLLYIEWINKVLLYSTGNYTQYLAINCNGKEKNVILKINFLLLYFERFIYSEL